MEACFVSLMVVVQPCVLLLGMISALRMGLEVIEGLVTETAVCLKHSFFRKLTFSFGFMLLSAICFLSTFWVYISYLLEGSFYC